jgi:hypothetical protein
MVMRMVLPVLFETGNTVLKKGGTQIPVLLSIKKGFIYE